ncbi:DNA internalization-related competence protein ComEC/Rec2 [Providencia stuartii]|uniref:DNA internalization-related competence protein ComEC/Rec2 n=1 Tax=Providencia stuartii TaxID=588 RepID=A0AAJ1JD04_PROST|nr:MULTISPECIES: DNA internalization-related competence protein ComEC/Rec2 [Providencia]EMA3640372.1 DNA internalization-related competence protein ComEC/Rec2 [Providencia stuartii]MBW3101756.1 DNA internalization-related competence protein ComEC/Rec2 [Providencia stuartii]MCB5215902.1 DNA internalization-related competence protein ComEC/Rec2 [Providencia stuartii]MDE8748918.1 DNA internalization-related competence protein ComEC/Rec2 [Providencia thailandensis]MDE8768218.1 DNA internalization-
MYGSILTLFRGGALSYTLAAIAIFIGTLPILFIHHIPTINNSFIISGILFLFLLFIKAHRYLKFFLLIAIAFLWACWHANDVIEKINLLSKKYQLLDVTIISVPLFNKEKENIKVRINKVAGGTVFPPLYAVWQVKHRSGVTICAGQTWQLNSLLKPLHASLNEGGFDQQRYSLSQRIIGKLKNTQTTMIDSRCSVRQRVIDFYKEEILSLKNAAITYALMFGERTLLTPELSALLQSTGVSHLIAISGLHIGLSYLLGYWLARCLLYLLPSYVISPKIPIIFGGIFAFLYGWVSGFAIPATRALIALGLWIYIKQQKSLYFSWQWAVWSIGLIVLADPLAMLSDSFWLSSFAVLAILYWFKLFSVSSSTQHTKVLGWLIPFVHLQTGLLILLAPIQMGLFQGINFMSFWANLWLVPIVSWLVVPLILLSFLLYLFPSAAIHHFILQLIDSIISIGIKPLVYLSDFWMELQSVSLWVSIFCWLIGVFISFGWHRTYIGLLGCFSALCIGTESAVDKSVEQGWSLTTLDVGHGLAVVIQQKGVSYLYDTGNRWQGGSNAQKQIIPYLKRKGIIPIGLILSHKHLDHIGGVPFLKKQYPWLNVRSSFGGGQHLPCSKGQRWQWGELHFEVLWPEKLAEKSHNDDSCVIMLTDGYHKILLTGDIEKQGEQAITALYKHRLNADIVFAPHHGSNTSSTSLFIRTISPTTVLVSSARYSPWKIPSDKVYLRYKNNNIKWINTAESGQVTIWFKKEKLNILRYRIEMYPRWYHLWFGDPPFPE